ncbi:pyocin activator protein PrtN [Kosakonia cowanii]|uniref:pyocin activator PrtN family protein n=1 Tax=Kosakonia cowanii TaxID=208223 RepID=UPI000B9798E2|nr:pyocin activator PrtN family protein [Kosakonia cowanii]AST68985.1 pyocin activator protein PrtN [Kosakonia cowanii]
MAEFETASIPLSYVCEKYFGMKPATADKKAALGQLPLPTFRAGESQKAPRMIHIQDLADYIEKQRAAGIEVFRQMNNK